MRVLHLKSEIAQRELSDLGRDACYHANHAVASPQSCDPLSPND